MLSQTRLPLWEQEESGNVRHPFEPAVLIATLLMIPVIIVQRDATSEIWLTVANAANWLIWAVFAAEMAFILVVAPRKLAALKAHWLDALLVVVTVPAYGRLLSSLRAVRLVRLLRLLRAGVIIARAIQAERRLTSAVMFRTVGLATVFLVVIAGAAQAEIDNEEFKSFWDGVWWAVVTVTTVGYGDLYPKNVPGAHRDRPDADRDRVPRRLTATIASQFVKADQNDDNAEILRLLRQLETDVAELKSRSS